MRPMIVHSPLKPRTVVYPSSSQFRDRALSDAVCAGRFTHLGITLDLGVEPDWLTAEVPVDKEWRREWSKFGYGRNLARAFGETNDVASILAIPVSESRSMSSIFRSVGTNCGSICRPSRATTSWM